MRGLYYRERIKYVLTTEAQSHRENESGFLGPGFSWFRVFLLPVSLCPCVSVVNALLLSTHREPIDTKSGRGDGPAELQVIRDVRDVEEHLFQISSHRDFFYRIG
jgi:hypothetical protein